MDNSTLQSIYAHPQINSTQYARIIDAHERVTYKKGEVLLKKGEVANDYCVIESGLIRKYVHDVDGNEITTRFHGRHEITVVSTSFFQRIASTENVIVAAETQGWRIDYQTFEALFGTIEGLREWGRSWMAGQLFLAEQRSIDIITKPATERYLELMKARPEVFQQVSLKRIASFLGVTDTSLSRIRKDVAQSK